MVEVTAPTAERVAALLAELGDHSDAIADRFRALGLKGVRKAVDCCPVAAYLQNCGIEGAMVDADSNDELFVRDFDRTLVGPVEFPGAVADFVLAFDRGVYLDLVEVPSC